MCCNSGSKSLVLIAAFAPKDTILDGATNGTVALSRRRTDIQSFGVPHQEAAHLAPLCHVHVHVKDQISKGIINKGNRLDE